MSGSRWMITPLWLSGSWRSFLYSSSVYSCHLFLIFSASVRSIPFLSFTVPIFAWNVPLVSLIFLKKSLVFPILLFSSISLHLSLRKAFLSLLAILWKFAFKWVYHSFPPLPLASVLFSVICKASSDNHFAFLHFFFLEMVLITAFCTIHEALSIVLQALCLAELIPSTYVSLPLYNHMGFDLSHSPWNSPCQNAGLCSYLRGSSQHRHRTQISHIAGRVFTSWAIREVHVGCTYL